MELGSSSMRRLSDAVEGSGHHIELLRLTPSQRLFVQRWIELFDWNSPIYFQIRPITLKEAKREASGLEGFQATLIGAEIEDLVADALQPFLLEMIDEHPLLAAEKLGGVSVACGLHPLYSFHALKILLRTEEGSFGRRLLELLEGWESTTQESYRLYFRITGGGVKPTNSDQTNLKVLPWPEVAEMVREAAAKSAENTAGGAAEGSQPVGIMQVSVRALDPNAALEGAIRAYYDYRACVRASSPATKPIPIDVSTAIIERPGSTEPKLIPILPRRFQMRGASKPVLLARLHRAAAQSGLFATFVRNFAEAIERLREGDLDSALEALVLNQDLAFYGCENSEGWRRARFLVEVGSRLYALEALRRYFDYLVVYCRQPSHAVAPNPLMRNENLSQILICTKDPWPLLVNDGRWSGVIARSDWDELLKHRRAEFVRAVENPVSLVREVQRRFAWDLARAVRARNALVHEGGYVSHHHTIGVLLDVYELVLRVRLKSIEERPSDPQGNFNSAARQILVDYNSLIGGRFTRSMVKTLCQEGWNNMWAEFPADQAVDPARDESFHGQP